ncbi:hypothetical protein C2845_PM07G29030 [Panicum miliaceum]|uniref:DUF2828 domain-containing protein n=1 Tax=Panicum miliaceum TaxID=4540 RepID=A0A3L6SR50_PANMI|nr:hypothetical protein C2845_PM07G29030 [Panicum miliaceum]
MMLLPRFLYGAVADFFATELAKDIKQVELNTQGSIVLSLAAKWCSSPYSPFDKTTLLYEDIACRFFPRDSDSNSDNDYVDRVREQLRHEVLVPLQSSLNSKSPKKNMPPHAEHLPHKIVQHLGTGQGMQQAPSQTERPCEVGRYG